ncbi:unnamed protein product [Caenorhabditis bovis]|uniref:Uncharacterized protein n=1 Tax=Caenorhabditis bovis TaxID=2654633 RepID=A0A8S1EYQ6_9PELO|nr:unnamed protein product [Caenorhabditis bovis]
MISCSGKYAQHELWVYDLLDVHRWCLSRFNPVASKSRRIGDWRRTPTFLISALENRWYYIGANRKDGCHAPKSVLLSRPECSVDKMFVFSDGVTEGTFLWNNHWSAQNPDSFYRYGEFESVIGIYNGLVGDWRMHDVLPGALCSVALC